MRTKLASVLIFCLPAISVAQEPSIISMDQEPHHHLVLQNAVVKVYDAKALPGDSLRLHRHEHDAVAIAIGDQTVTVGVPGKPDVHSKSPDGQVRMQRSGYVHSTHVDGDAPYFTVAIDLLQPQTGSRNLCATVLAGEPLHCPETPGMAPSVYISRPQFESDQTDVRFVRVLPHQAMNIAEYPASRNASQLIVALDAVTVSLKSSRQSDKVLRSGDAVWFDGGPATSRMLKNQGEKEARFVEIIFPRRP